LAAIGYLLISVGLACLLAVLVTVVVNWRSVDRTNAAIRTEWGTFLDLDRQASGYEANVDALLKRLDDEGLGDEERATARAELQLVETYQLRAEVLADRSRQRVDSTLASGGSEYAQTFATVLSVSFALFAGVWTVTYPRLVQRRFDGSRDDALASEIKAIGRKVDRITREVKAARQR
jgi:hypothetical protein